MTPSVTRWRRHGSDDRRFARMVAVSLAIHGVLAWLLFYHLEQFVPTHRPSAYLVELLTPAGVIPEPQLPVAEEAPMSPAPEPLPQQFKAPSPELPPMPVPLEPPPQQIPVTPPPTVTKKSQPELAPPQSLQRKVQLSPATAPPQLHETVVSRTPASRDVELAAPSLTKQQARGPDNGAVLPESQALPLARKNQDVGDSVRAAPNYQTPRQPSKETLPEPSSGLNPTTASRGDVAVPDRHESRTEPRAPRTEPSLPVDRGGQQLAARSNSATIASPRGPSMPTKVSRAGGNEPLPGSSPSSFSAPAARNASIPLPGSSGPAVSPRASTVATGAQMPADKTPQLQATPANTRLDQESLAAFRSLKTCLDTEQESRLKMTLARLLSEDATCRSGSTRYFFAATETAYSLQVGIATGAGQVFKDRCDALQQAVRCIEQSRK